MFNQLRGMAAPVDPVGLKAVLADFGESRMLPPAAYVDAAVFAWEQANIFDGWTCVGYSAGQAAPGSQRAVAVGTTSALLVRDEGGVLRAFANTCRHRGHELLPCGGAGEQRRSIICPYHSWSYKLDGSLRNAPSFRGVDGFEPEHFGLVSLPVAEWHGWIFLDPSGVAGPFAKHVGEIGDVIAPYRPEELTILARHEYELAANWKVIAENYQECYHCSTIHPELSRISPPDSGENLPTGSWLGGWMGLIPSADTMSLDGRSGGALIAGLSERERRSVMYIVGFPNLLVSLHPDYVMTHVLQPLAADRTSVECVWAFPRSVADDPAFDPAYAVDFWDLTNKQDWAACESVQRGLSSPHAQPGPLAPEEDGVYQFVQRVARLYAGGAS